MHRRSQSFVPLAVGLVAMLAAAAPTATAHPPAASVVPLEGYQQVASALLNDPAGSQVTGTVGCPTGYKVVGGGATITGSSLSRNLNSSYPVSSTTWAVSVNNSSGTNATFRVYANCVKKVRGYVIAVGTGVDNPAGTNAEALVTCPTGKFPLGGGGLSSSTSTAVSLNTSYPRR
jgi:hypothetical protein